MVHRIKWSEDKQKKKKDGKNKESGGIKWEIYTCILDRITQLKAPFCDVYSIIFLEYPTIFLEYPIIIFEITHQEKSRITNRQIRG